MRNRHWILVMCCIPGLIVAAAIAEDSDFFGNQSERSGDSVGFEDKADSDSEDCPKDTVSETSCRFRRSDAATPPCPSSSNGSLPKLTTGETFADGGECAKQCPQSSGVVAAKFETNASQPTGEIRKVQGRKPAAPTRQSLEADRRLSGFDFSEIERPNAFDIADVANPFSDNDRTGADEDLNLPDRGVLRRISVGNRDEGALPHPTADDTRGPQTPMLTVEWVRKGLINVGQRSECELVIRNNGKITAGDVVVEAYLPQSVRLLAANPRPLPSTETLAWRIGELEPGGRQSIGMQILPQSRGEVDVIAIVRFSGRSTDSLQVEEPRLEIAMRGPGRVTIGNSASHVIAVSNPGTGVARNVAIQALVPDGLEHRRGRRIVMDIGPLNPGESRDVRLALTAMRGGNHRLQVRVVADGDLSESSESLVTVVAPQLKLAIEGPDVRYVGRNADYTVRVANDGAATSDNVRVKYRVPEGFSFVRTGGGGKLNPYEQTVDWFLGRLESGQAARRTLTLKAEQAGTFAHQAGAIAEHGSTTTAELDTRIEGVALLAIEIRDLDDPVEIGDVATYVVRVRNEGSKAARGVGLSCELPAGIKLVDARGPSQFIAENGLVVFKSVESLEPGSVAAFEIDVRGIRSGSHRIRARLASDSIQEPLITEELTRFSGE